MVTQNLAKISESFDSFPSRNKSIKDWKDQGKKVIGYVCSTIPEEIIYAGGALPVRLIGSTEPVSEVDTYLVPFCCYFVRSTLDLALRGGYGDLDGVVTSLQCDTMVGLGNLFYEFIKMPFNYSFICRPEDANAVGALEFYSKEIAIFKKSFEDFIGHEIADESLCHAIRVYNENRALLRELYDLRGKEPQPLVSGVEVARVVMAGMEMPKEEHNELLRAVLPLVRERTGANKEDRIRVVLEGGFCEQPPLDLILPQVTA